MVVFISHILFIVKCVPLLVFLDFTIVTRLLKDWATNSKYHKQGSTVIHLSPRGHPLKATGPILGFSSVVQVTSKVRQARKQMDRGLRSRHTLVSCDWPWSCVAGRWQSVLPEHSVKGLLFGFGCTGAWKEQLGHNTGFPLFMWGPGIDIPAHCCAGGAAPTATYRTTKSVEGHSEGEGIGWTGGFPSKNHETGLWAGAKAGRCSPVLHTTERFGVSMQYRKELPVKTHIQN